MNQLYQWISNFSLHQKLRLKNCRQLVATIFAVIGFTMFTVQGFSQSADSQNISTTSIAKLAKLAVKKVRKNPNSENYFAAAQGIELWWIAYELALKKQIKEKMTKPNASKKTMLYYAGKSAELGNFDAANFLSNYYGTNASESHKSKAAAECWDRVLDEYVARAASKKKLIRKCLQLAK